MAPKHATWNGKDSQGNPLRWNSPNLVWNGLIPEPQPAKHMPHLRVSLSFTYDTDPNLHNRATAVSAGLFTATTAYPDPPEEASKIILDAANKAFDDAVSVAKTGSQQDTAAKNNKRAILIALLRQLAAYVQMKHGDDLEVLLSSGYEAVATNHAPATLDAPHIREILNGHSGEFIVHADPMANVRLFAARIAPVTGSTIGAYVNAGLHSDSRHISLTGLTPGTIYSVQLQAVGGGNHVSDWSDPVQHMSM
jgi:hypothetical protein